MTAANFVLTGTATSGAGIGTPTTSNGGIVWTVPVTTGVSGTLGLNLNNRTGIVDIYGNQLYDTTSDNGSTFAAVVGPLYTIEAVTTTAVSSSLNPSIYGQSVTFTATVTNTSGAGGVPTGSIEFYDNSTMLGAGTTLSGTETTATSTFAISTLPEGDYSISAVYTATGNFLNSTSSILTQTVNAAMLTITANSTSKIYGTTLTFAGTEFTDTGLVNDDSVSSVTLTSAGAAATATVDGSPYAIVPSAATGSGLDNYTITYVNGNLTVTTAALTITANSTSKTYGDTVSFAGTEFTDTGLLNEDTVTSVTLTSAGAAATATVDGSSYAIVPSAATGTGLDNYTITYVNGNLTVTTAALTITANSTSKTYGTTVTFAGSEFTDTGLVNDDSVTSVTLTSAGAAATATVDGSPYAIVPSAATGSGLDNYTITYVNGNLTVTTATLTITANSTSKTYGDTVSFAGTEFTDTGLLNEDTVTSVTLTSAGAAATATVDGSPYAIVPSAATGTGLDNYTITYVNGNLTVTTAALTITANSTSKTYGDTVSFAGTEFTDTGLLNEDTVTSVTLTSAGAAATATVDGSPYAIVPSAATGSGLDNYTITYVNGNLTVTTAALTITANSTTKTYGDTVSFAGTEFTDTGLLNEDTVTSVTLTSAGAAATATVDGSPYAIVPSAATGSGLDNYTITYVNGNLTVTTAAMTITANSTSKTYGTTLTFAGTEFTDTGLINDDSVTSVTLTSAGAAATATVDGSPYAIVPSAATGTGLDNYTITYVNGNLTVTTAALTITANSTSKTYGDTVSFAGTEFTDTGLLNEDTVTSVTLTSAGAAATATVDGSPYAIVPSAATGTGLDNYTITYVNGNLTVTTAALTITANSTSKTYGTTLTFAGTEFTDTGLINDDSVTSVTLTSAGAAATATVDGSPYAIVPSAATGTGLDNYTITYVDGNLTVTTAALTITANSSSKTYGDTVSFAGTEFTDTGLLNEDTVTSVTLTSAGAAATATVDGSPYAVVPSAATGSGLDNYTIIYVNGNLTVTTAALTITANSTSKTYGDTVSFAGTEFTDTGLLNEDTVTSVTLTSAGAAATATVDGSPYAIVPSAATGSGLDNYTITYVNGNLTVTTAALTITANSTSKTYGTTLTFAGTEFTDTGLINDDSVSSVTLTSAGAAATATVDGSPYAIVPSAATGTGLDNYTITYVNGNLTVTTATLTITANSTSKTYGDTVSFAGTEFTDTGLLNEDTVTSVTLTSAGAAATATVDGSPYAIVPSAATGTGLDNYTITYVNGNLTVTTATLTITANSTSKTYGTTLTFAGTEFTDTGLVNGDSVSSVTLTSAGAAATATVDDSPYAIVPSAATGTGLDNYTITYVNGNLTVTTAALTITANSTSKTYGDTVSFAGTEFTDTGLLNEDTVTSVTLTSAGAAATATVDGSPYAIVPSAATGSGLDNYTIIYVNGNLTVTTAALTITANSTSKTYGTTLTFAGTEFTDTGLVNGDSVSSVTLTSAGAAATATVDGSPYAIVPSAATGTGLDNYTITYVNGNLTVTTAALTITANSTSKTYGDAVSFAGTEFTDTGLLNEDTVTSVTLTSAGAAATATVDGSPYAIVPSAAIGTGLDNYTITYVNGNLTVTTAALTITANSTSKTYGTTLTFAGTEFTDTGLINDDSVTSVTLTSAGAVATATVDGSPYAIVPSAATGSGLDNYTIIYVNGNLTVTTATLTITANSTSKTYGDTVSFAGSEFTDTGLVNDDSVTSVTLTSAGAAATATVDGSPYAIVPTAATGSGLDNYTITYVNGNLTVTTATLTITANSTSKTYGTTLTFAGTEFTDTGLVNGDSVSSVTLTSAGAAATATVDGSPYAIVPSAATGTGLDNYTITYVDGNLTVTTAALTITANSTSKTYGDTVSFAGTEFTDTGLLNEDTVTSVTLTSAGAAATATVDGSPYAIVPSAATGSGLDNYTIIYVNGNLTVTTAALTITANSTSKTYGTTLTFAGTEFTDTGLVNDDSVSSVTLTSAGAAATATVDGSPYAIVPSAATGTGLDNYTITYVNGNLTVTTAALTITANSTSKTYGDAVSFAGTEFTDTGLLNEDTVTSVTLTSAGAAATATVDGSPYAIVPSAATGTGLDNYTITYVNGNLTVTTAALTITANSTSKTYGTTLTFAGTEFTDTGLINDDSVTSVTLTSAGAAATATVDGSPYAIVPSAATGSGLDNYTITYVNGNLTVTTATLTIIANSTSKTYGTTVSFAGSEFTDTGLVNDDSITSVTLTSAGAAATATVDGSPYAIVPTAAIGSGLDNYTIIYVNGNLTVNTAALTITANSTSKTYGTTVTFTGSEFTDTGLVNGDSVSSVTLTSAGAAATATVDGSPYAIVPSAATGTGLDNYTITYVDGNLTVTTAALTITANSTTKTYGTTLTLAGTEFTDTGLINDDSVTSVTLTSAGAAATATVDGSPYAIVPTAAIGNGLDNYTITYVNGNLTVTTAALTITANSTTKTYGTTRTFAGTEFTDTGLVNGDSVTSVTLTSAGAAATATVDGSPYAIVPSAATGTGLDNYTITYVNGNLTVTTAALTITANSTSKTYGTTVSFAGTEFTDIGLVNDDSVTSVTLASAGAAAAATVDGSPYAIVPTAAIGSGLDNYTIIYVNGNLTVTTAALTITANSTSKTYGDTVSFAGTEFTDTGLLNEDTVTSVTLTTRRRCRDGNRGRFALRHRPQRRDRERPG